MNSIAAITYYSISPLLSLIILFWKHQLQNHRSLLLRVRFKVINSWSPLTLTDIKSVGNRVSAPLKSCVITFIFPWWETEKKIALTIGEWHLCNKCFEDLKFYNKNCEILNVIRNCNSVRFWAIHYSFLLWGEKFLYQIKESQWDLEFSKSQWIASINCSINILRNYKMIGFLFNKY